MAEILGKDLDNWDDSLAAREPYSLSESNTTGAQFMTGADLLRSAKISAEWRDPVAIYAQAYNPMSKPFQVAESTLTSAVDTVRNLPSNVANLGAQTFIELTEGEKRALPDVSGALKAKTGEETLDKLRKALSQSQQSIDETIFLLKDRDYPVSKFARRVIADTTANVENRRIVRELYNQAHGIDSSKWYNEAGSIIGAMLPAMVAGNVAFSGARAFGAGRLAAVNTAKNIVKGYIGAEMAGQYAEETAAEYLERTGDKNFEKFTAKDASGMMAAAYGAIGAQIEFMGGVEPVFAGALTKVGLRSSALKAAAKIGAGEATEELLQGLTETLMRKIDGTSDKTWKEGFEESLKGAAWGLFIGGSLGTTAFYTNRRNLVKGIKVAVPGIEEAQAELIADAMIDTTGEISSQEPSLRNNLRQKVALMYEDADIENKEDRIDAITDLEYSLVAMDAMERGIDLAEHELFAGEVNDLGWFRTGIPEARRVEIQEINDNIRDLKTQLKELNKAEQKDWAKIEEIENKLAQANQYVLDKLSDLARDDAAVVRRMLRGVEEKYVRKEQKKAGIKVPTDIIEQVKSDKSLDFTDIIETNSEGYKQKTVDGINVEEVEVLGSLQDVATKAKYGIESKAGNWSMFTIDYRLGVITMQPDLDYFPFSFSLLEYENSGKDFAHWAADKIDEFRNAQKGKDEFEFANAYAKEHSFEKATENNPIYEEGKNVLFQEQFDLADENARLDDIYPAYTGDTIRIIDPAELKQAQYKVIQRTNPMQDEYHVGIRSVNDIKTFDETIDDKDSFVWGDYSQEDAKRDLAKNEITIYSSKPIENGVFVSTSYRQAQEYAGGKGAKVYKKTVPLDYVAWISGDEGQFAITDVVGKKRSVYNSNGERIAQSEPALRNFYKWFGDSKVVDEQGRPIVMYHGTSNTFDSFDPTTFGYATDSGFFGSGFYFTPIESEARYYGRIVMPVYLKIEKPFIVSTGGYYSGLYDNLFEGGGQLLKDLGLLAENDLKDFNKYERLKKEFLKNAKVEKIYTYDAKHNEVQVWRASFEKNGRSYESNSYRPWEEVGYNEKEDTKENALNNAWGEYAHFNDLNFLIQDLSFTDYIRTNGLAEELSNIIKSRGYDGTIAGDEHIVFEPNQIKSINNRGTYSADTGNIYYQPAYAGARADYDKPSLEAIGSGEGNQAHGWGLYYALNPEIAENYRKKLADDYNQKILYKGKEISYDYHNSDNIKENVLYEIELYMDEYDNNIQKTIDAFIKKNKQELSDWETRIEADKKLGIESFAKVMADRLNLLKEKITILQSLNEKDFTRKQKGQVHEVDIPEMDVLLDEQKMLIDQPQHVQDAIQKINTELNLGIVDSGIRGDAIYNKISDKLGSDEKASKLLDKYGIKGITYFGRVDGRCFVIFNPESVKVLRKKFDELGNVLFQNRVSGATPATYRGAYIPTYRFILRANRMDASTLSHELAHDWFETNFARYRSGKATKDFMRAWGALEKALGVPENATSTPRQASEAFARAYEAWIVQNEDWAKLVNVEDKDRDAVEKLMKDYQNDLRDIYNDISNPYFKQTWGKLGELKPELKAWFDRVVNITDLDVMVERGEMTEEEAGAERLNRAIDTVIENTADSSTIQVLKEARTLNDTKRYEAEGGNKNSLQMRLSALAREIDENNMLVKENYDTRRDMMAVAEAADNFVKTRLDDALAIINGQMAEVEGLYKEDLYTALERLAIENGDLGLIDELKNSEIANRLGKELGQRVAGFRNFKQSTDLDVVSALKSLDNSYNKALENKKAQKQFNEALAMLDKSLKAQDSIADKELDATLKELECK